MMALNPTIYHITHVDNLPGILQHRCLLCDNDCVKQGVRSIEIAYNHLKLRRRQTPVPIAAGGNLGDYVPFYFCNRSPMLCTIKAGNVEAYKGNQEEIIYIVSNVKSVTAGNVSQWCFTDGHAVEQITEFYDAIDRLDQIDWDLIQDWSWRNLEFDNDRKRRKQAEFLVYKTFLFSWVKKIGVYGEGQKLAVEEILNRHHCHVPVVVEKKWYYD